MKHQAPQTFIQSPPNKRGRELLAGVGSYIQTNDEPGLIRFLRTAWPLTDLMTLLNDTDSKVSRTAAYCLGMVGGRAAVLPLAGALCHDDSTVVTAAEDAMWRLWFNAAGGASRRKLRRGVDLIEEGRYDAAIESLDDLIAHDPDFAEAYHQRALARHLQEDYLGSVADYKQTVRLNPCHFGALAGMGRAHADIGQVAEALAAYRQALRVHPRMEGVRQSIRKIHALQDRCQPIPLDE